MFDRILFKPAGFDQILTVCVFYNYVSHKLCKEWHLGEIVEYGAQCNANVECVFANDGLNIKTKNLIEWENENLHRLDSTVKSRFISKNSFIIDSLDVHAMQDIISLLTCEFKCDQYALEKMARIYGEEALKSIVSRKENALAFTSDNLQHIAQSCGYILTIMRDDSEVMTNHSPLLKG